MTHFNSGTIHTLKEGEQSNKIKISLKPHQISNILHMKSIEEDNNRFTYNIDMGVLSDTVGYGKSLCILGLIADTKLCKPKTYNMIKSNNHGFFRQHKYSAYRITSGLKYYTHFDPLSGDNTNISDCFMTVQYKPTEIINSNLIVVPHNIYSQWRDYIQKYTTLSCYYIYRKKHIVANFKKYNQYDIVLCKATRYNELMSALSYSYEKKVNSHYNSVYTIFDDFKINSTYCNMKHCVKLINDIKVNKTFKKNKNMLFQLMDTVKNNLTSFDKEGFLSNECKLTNYNQEFKGYNNKYVNVVKGPIWSRVIIDEADSVKGINIPIHGFFHWYITSSLDTLFFRTRNINSAFIRNAFQNNSKGIFNVFWNDYVVKNRQNILIQSFNIKDPIHKYILCKTPTHIHILSGLVDSAVLECLSADNIPLAIQRLGCEVKSQTGVVKTLTNDIQQKINKLQKQKENYQKELIDLHRKLFSSVEEEKKNISSMISYRRKRISETPQRVKLLTERLNEIKNRITKQDDNCPICLDTVSVPTQVKCCKNMFCLKCITLTLRQRPRCPMCRSDVKTTDLCVIKTDKEKKEEDEKERKEREEEIKNNKPIQKIDNLLKIIHEKKEGKFLIFSNYDETFRLIERKLDESKITHRRVCGNGYVIDNIVRGYTSGTIKVLMLNTKYYASGMNLEMTTDIIIYHKLTKDLERQVIGRGQRLGRTCVLNVHHLCYDNEMK